MRLARLHLLAHRAAASLACTATSPSTAATPTRVASHATASLGRAGVQTATCPLEVKRKRRFYDAILCSKR
eukprot:COSAG06_NODE_6199_length_3054_cov_1.959391_2_plen_71_part_00